MRIFTCILLAAICCLNGEILDQAREHLSKCPKTVFNKDDAYPKYLALGLDQIPRFNTAQEAIHFAQLRIPFDHRERISPESAAFCESDLRAEFPMFAEFLGQMSESPYTESLFLDYLGRKVSNVFYFQCWALFRNLSIGRPKIVCDVGSGYGFTALLWMQNPIFTPDVYILVDFPESLFFAELFLKTNLREIPVIHMCSGEFKEQAPPYILLCPIGKEDELHRLPIEWVVNLGSLQHMSEDWVDHWMQWLDASQAQYFYSLNFGIAPLIKKFWLCGGATDYAPRLSDQWSYLLNSAKGPFWPKDLCVKCPGELEILAQRTHLRRNRDELVEEFWKPRSWDRQGFAERLDIVRLCPDEELIWALICGAFSEMGEEQIPQEVRYLFNQLKKTDFLLDKGEMALRGCSLNRLQSIFGPF
jgi:putative sugar O-methyltransferase